MVTLRRTGARRMLVYRGTVGGLRRLLRATAHAGPLADWVALLFEN